MFLHANPEVSYLTYIQNKGQWNTNVLFKTGFRGGSLFVEKTAFTYVFYQKEGFHSHDIHTEKDSKTHPIELHVLRMDFENADPAHQVLSLDKEPFYHNYFIGNDPKNWASEVGIFKTVVHKNMYPGIDVKVFGRGNDVRYDFIVSPNADPSVITLKFEGQERLSLKDGKLLIKTSVGEITQEAPYAFQHTKDGSVKRIDCRYVLDKNKVTIKITGNYDSSLPLVIDPTLIFSTYTGSLADNWGASAAFDIAGNGYTAGRAFNVGYPITTGAFQSTFGGPPSPFGVGGDITLSKFSSTGSLLMFSTYLGGNSTETPQSIIVDNNNCLIVLGRTISTNFPVMAGCYDVAKNLGSDITVTKFNPLGTAILGSTFIGGSGDDGININDGGFLSSLKSNYSDDGRGAVHVDANNNIYVSSCTQSSDFPVTPGCFQPSAGGMQDGCVFKFNGTLTSLLFSSYLGGSANDAAYNLAIDALNGLYVTGGTESANFPVTPGAFKTVAGGNIDGFVTHISASGANILQSSYIGTNLYDQSYFVQVDSDNDVYLYGQCSGNYSCTALTYSNASSGQFIHKLDSTLSTTLFSTMFGAGNGTPDIVPSAFLVDNCKSIYVSGWGGALGGSNNLNSTTNGMPVTPNAFQPNTDGNDFYFAAFKQNASAMQYGTFFGGALTAEHVDGGTSCFDKTGVIYQAICASCGGLQGMPTTPTAWSTTNNAPNCNNGLVKFEMDLIKTIAQASLNLNNGGGCAPFAANLVNTSSNAATFVWYFGNGNTSTSSTPNYTYANPGSYLVTLIASDTTTCNKSDTAFLTITVLPPAVLVPELSPANVCKGESVQLNMTFPQANTFTWSPAATLTNPFIYNPFASPTTNMIYTLTLNDSLCQVVSTRTVMVTVRENFTDIVDQNICSGDTITIHTSSVYTSYQWNTGAITPSITGLLEGLFSVNTVDSFGCKGFDSIRIYRIIDIEPSAVRICEGLGTQLFAPSGNYQYTWTPSAYLTSTNIANPIAGPVSSMIYTLSLANGPCVSSNSFTVTLKPRPSAWIKTDGTNLCEKDTVKLHTMENPSYQSYLWNTGDTTSSIIVVGQGNYTVTVLDTNGCYAVDTIILKGSLRYPEDGERKVICRGQSINLGRDSDHDSSYTYRWYPEADIAGNNTYNPIVNPKSTRIYTVLVSNSRCISAIHHTVFVKPSPPLSLISHYESIIPGESVQLGGIADSSCNWYPDYMLSCTECDNPIAEPLETTVYHCYVVNAQGCSTTNTVIVEVIPTLYIPDTFTPDGDGLNDVFRPVFSGFVKMKMSIFNRWGQEIFSFDDLNGGWNGTFQGEKCPVGAYAYILTATDNRRKVIEKAGSVLLLK